ncbi:hypothetical protein OCU04_012032 [Sclerotinia nivalis]|uniref:Uncharacterized protein n=1 Tax=Sclerotinia nivalis TaxID=352851 RepID=A0A9X0AA41_9HELO|nr:hypothetical protein OCU04_012032 [Sclerotinia nivalis]
MCPEAENKGKFGDCESGIDDQSGKAMPVEEASFCLKCGQSVEKLKSRPMPTKEERDKDRRKREEVLDECAKELNAAMEQSGGDILEKRRALGDAVFNFVFYRERVRWEQEVEKLEDAYPNDAERLKEGKDKLREEFEKSTEGISRDYTKFNEDMGTLLERVGLDQAHFLPNGGFDP